MWDWRVGTYLFLGGLGAGLFTGAALLQLAYGNRFMRAVRAGVCPAIVAVGVGTLLLLSEVGQPARALSLFASFSNVEQSWMARGVWIIASFVITAVVYLAVAATPWERLGLGWLAARFRAKALNVIGVVGAALSACLALYTGLLLMFAQRIALWDSPILPVLFLLSGLESGTALLLFIACRSDRHDGASQRRLRQARMVVSALFILEALALCAYLTSIADGASMTALRQAALPWGVVLAIGMVGTAGAEASSFARVVPMRSATSFAALSSLVAGFALRLFVLQAGIAAAPAFGFFVPETSTPVVLFF